MRFVIYSGGMDSFTLLHHVMALARETTPDPTKDVVALSFMYGQRHSRELDYARAETQRLGIRHELIDLRSVTPHLQGSALTTSMPVPEGHYAEESMRKTVVPGRNTMMLSIAMAVAEGFSFADREAKGLASWQAVFYGAHSGDHHIYPDCRPGYLKAMQRSYMEATDGMVSLHAPFINDDKTSILQRGRALGLTAEDYGRSWTCYKGEEHACGVCGSCNERAEAFAAVGWEDPALAHFRQRAK